MDQVSIQTYTTVTSFLAVIILRINFSLNQNQWFDNLVFQGIKWWHYVKKPIAGAVSRTPYTTIPLMLTECITIESASQKQIKAQLAYDYYATPSFRIAESSAGYRSVEISDESLSRSSCSDFALHLKLPQRLASPTTSRYVYPLLFKGMLFLDLVFSGFNKKQS